MKEALAIVFVLVLCKVTPAQQPPPPVSPEQVACIKPTFEKGIHDSAPNGPIYPCQGGGLIAIMPHAWMKDMKIQLGMYQEETCTTFFFVGSFQPGFAPPDLVVEDFCSPAGQAWAYFVGAHEGQHKLCDPFSSACEELAASVASVVQSCGAVASAVACICNADCEQLLADFPLLDKPGPPPAGVDLDGVRNFANQLCKAMGREREKHNSESGRAAAYACACDGYNDVAPATCQVPSPPGGCDGTPPSEADAASWPIPDCGSCPVPSCN